MSENISRGKRREQKNNKHKIFNESSVYYFHISHTVKRQKKKLTPSSSGKPIVPLDGFEISLLQSCTGIYKKQYNKLPLLMELSGRTNNGHSEKSLNNKCPEISWSGDGSIPDMHVYVK